MNAAVDRLGLIPLAPAATALMQGSDCSYDNGENDKSVMVTRRLWLELRQQSGYTPQLQALPWGFVQSSIRKEQEGSLQLHSEKKALADILAIGENKPKLFIEFNPAIDCHGFSKSSWPLESFGEALAQITSGPF